MTIQSGSTSKEAHKYQQNNNNLDKKVQVTPLPATKGSKIHLNPREATAPLTFTLLGRFYASITCRQNSMWK